MSKHKNKKDPYGIPNVNFTLDIEDRGLRHKFKKQRLERGFDNTELWNLDYTLAEFLLPRLKAFREQTFGCPGCFVDDYEPYEDGMDKWYAILDEMIWALETYIKCEDSDFKYNGKSYYDMTREEMIALDEKINNGLNLISKYWRCLWW